MGDAAGFFVSRLLRVVGLEFLFLGCCCIYFCLLGALLKLAKRRPKSVHVSRKPKPPTWYHLRVEGLGRLGFRGFRV